MVSRGTVTLNFSFNGIDFYVSSLNCFYKLRNRAEIPLCCVYYETTSPVARTWDLHLVIYCLLSHLWFSYDAMIYLSWDLSSFFPVLPCSFLSPYCFGYTGSLESEDWCLFQIMGIDYLLPTLFSLWHPD